MARSVAITPGWRKKRRKLRKAVAINLAGAGLYRRACCRMKVVTS